MRRMARSSRVRASPELPEASMARLDESIADAGLNGEMDDVYRRALGSPEVRLTVTR